MRGAAARGAGRDGGRRSDWTLAIVVGVVSFTMVSCTALAQFASGSFSSWSQSRVQPSAVLCPTENDEALRYYNDAHDFEQVGKLEEATALYLKAIEADPNYCDAMDNLGLLLRRQGKLDEAMRWYQWSIEVLPDNPVARQNLAAVYVRQGKLDGAMAEFRTLTQSHPENPEGYFGLGAVHVDRSQPAEAIPHLKKAEELYRESGSPYVIDAWYLLGVAYYRLQQWSSAKQYFEQAYPQLQNQPDINFYLGMCYLSEELKNPGLARKYLGKAKALGKNVPPEVLQDLEG